MGQAENNLGTYLKLILLKCGLDHFVDLQWTIYFLYKIKVLNMSCIFIFLFALFSHSSCTNIHLDLCLNVSNIDLRNGGKFSTCGLQ